LDQRGRSSMGEEEKRQIDFPLAGQGSIGVRVVSLEGEKETTMERTNRNENPLEKPSSLTHMNQDVGDLRVFQRKMNDLWEWGEKAKKKKRIRTDKRRCCWD